MAFDGADQAIVLVHGWNGNGVATSPFGASRADRARVDSFLDVTFKDDPGKLARPDGAGPPLGPPMLRRFALLALVAACFASCGSDVTLSPEPVSAQVEPTVATPPENTPASDPEYFIGDVAFRVVCDDAMESHIVPDSYTKQEAIDSFCFGLGTAVDTPGLYGVTCLDDLDLDYFVAADRETTATNFCRRIHSKAQAGAVNGRNDCLILPDSPSRSKLLT